MFKASSRYLPVALCLALPMLLAAPLQADRAQAEALTAQARALIDQGQYDPARDLLRQALQADPRYTEAYVWSGYLEEVEGHVEPAVAAYGQALALNPEHHYAREHLRALFYGKHFPRRLPLDLLPLSPLEIVVDKAQALVSFPGERLVQETRIAYTTGLLYPEKMKASGALLTLPLPIAGAESGEKVRLNRVVYGFIAEPGATAATMRVAVYYPSPTISTDGKDYAPLAGNLVHWLTRLFAYYELHLGTALPADPMQVYLCEAGPSGAETYEGALYFYNVDENRPALEWMREAAHESGHLLLPKMGRFTEPEPWGNGHMGERLVLQWLAQEAGLVAGAPWPASAAQDKLKGLWAGQPLPLADYLAKSCRPLLDAWAQAGPEASLLGQDDEAALSYLLGFLLWVQAAHNDSLLAATLTGAVGTNPSDYVRAYQEAVRQRLAGEPGAYLPLWAGALNLPASRLTEKPTEGALRRENLTLKPGDIAIWPLYLPAGTWNVVLVGTVGAHFAVKFDDQPVTLQADKHGMFTVTTGEPAWHQISAEMRGEEAAALDYLRVEPGREA